ncbi:MAG: hypothetical protein Q8R92_05235, partial [Deltaproteobacteria bacterium]|nr:hypothetical protein [Deltaproteobacteria bacterium]
REDENRTARVSKLKDGEDGRIFGFVLKTVSVGMDEDGDDISSCVVEHTEAVAPREKAKRLGKRMDLVLRAIQDEQRPDNLGALVQDVIDAYRAATPLPPGGRDQRPSHVMSALESLALMGKCKLVAPDRVVLITQGE